MGSPTDPNGKELGASLHLIMDKTWLKSVKIQFFTYRHTEQLESFHNVILAYAPNELLFSKDVNYLYLSSFHSTVVVLTKTYTKIVFSMAYILREGWSRVIKHHYVSDVPYVLIAQLNMVYRGIDTYDCGGLLCKSCSQDEELHELVTLYKLGGKLEYTVPSFPVFKAELRPGSCIPI